jgi:hypothetical protein
VCGRGLRFLGIFIFLQLFGFEVRINAHATRSRAWLGRVPFIRDNLRRMNGCKMHLLLHDGCFVFRHALRLFCTAFRSWVGIRTMSMVP